jgi:glycosidase
VNLRTKIINSHTPLNHLRALAQGLTLLNFLGNHDTPRVCSRLKDAAALYPLAAAFLLTAAGVPCLYYGDEVGCPRTEGYSG